MYLLPALLFLRHGVLGNVPARPSSRCFSMEQRTILQLFLETTQANESPSVHSHTATLRDFWPTIHVLRGEISRREFGLTLQRLRAAQGQRRIRDGKALWELSSEHPPGSMIGLDDQFSFHMVDPGGARFRAFDEVMAYACKSARLARLALKLGAHWSMGEESTVEDCIDLVFLDTSIQERHVLRYRTRRLLRELERDGHLVVTSDGDVRPVDETRLNIPEGVQGRDGVEEIGGQEVKSRGYFEVIPFRVVPETKNEDRDPMLDKNGAVPC